MLTSQSKSAKTGVYPSTTDQVLLALLWAVHCNDEPLSEETLAEIFAAFQQRTGTILYGPVRRSDLAALRFDLAADLESLAERGLIYRTPNPHAEITVLGIPAASTLALPPPLDQLVDLARERLSRAQ